METTTATVKNENKAKDIVLLILRIAAGAFLMYSGIPKLMWGPNGDPSWTKLGGTMGLFGITSVPTFWGFMAAFSEGVGGLLILLGFIFRPAAFLVLCTMFVAVYMHVTVMHGGYGPALTLAILAVLFLIAGPGRYSIGKRKTV